MSQLEQFLWRVQRTDNGLYETTISATEPTVAPSDGGPINADQTVILESKFVSIVSEGYTNLESILADNQAVKINASNAAGGIDIDAGTGGITVDSTNSISIDAQAASNFSVTGGNLTLESNAVTCIESSGTGSAGVNVGTNPVDQTLNLGTGTGVKTINIGNTSGATKIDINTGTGGFIVDTANGGTISLDALGISSNFTLTTNADDQDLTIGIIGNNDCSLILDSQGTSGDALRFNSNGGIYIDAVKKMDINISATGTDSYRLNTAGGIDVDATESINIATGDNVGGAITLDAAFNNGGITISSGSQGIAINSGSGLIGIGHWSAGNMDIGTSATARTITLGNTTGTTSIVINAGTGGITIGNNSNGGEIQIGNTSTAKTLTIGNNTGASKLFTRWGTGGNVKFQGAETALANASATLTMTQILTQILTMAPSTDRTLTMPTAANAVSGISGVQVNDCIDFVIIHTNTGGSDPFITLAMGSGGTAIGFMDIHPRTNFAGTYFYSGSATFRLRFTNVTASSEAYTVYRIA